MKTSIKFKKFWFADVAPDGGCGTNWVELQAGQREGTAQFNGSDADTTIYKNVLGNALESAIVKGDKTVNFQFADLTPAIIAAFTGGSVTDDANATTISAPNNENQSIEKSIMFLTDKNVLCVIPRCSFDGYPMFNDDDLHYYQMNSTVLKPTKDGVAIYSMSVLKLPSEAKILSFVLAEQTGAVTINDGLKTVAITVENGTDPSALTPAIGISMGASIMPESGSTEDFTNPVSYVVEAADGTKATWTVTVTVAP